MFSTFSERFEKFYSSTGLSKGDFAELLDIPGSQLSRYLNNNQVPQEEKLKNIAKAGCNLHWLLTGEGDMFAKNAAGEKLRSKWKEDEYGITENELSTPEETILIPRFELRQEQVLQEIKAEAESLLQKINSILP